MEPIEVCLDPPTRQKKHLGGGRGTTIIECLYRQNTAKRSYYIAEQRDQFF